MKRIINIFLISSICMTLSAQNYLLDVSAWQWTGKDAFSAYSLSGTLDQKTGSMTIVDDQLTQGEVIIDMLTLDAENKDLRKHLRSKDFFEVKKYKEAVFRLTKGTVSGDRAYLEGELTIKDKTQKIIIEPKITREDGVITLSGQMVLDRTKYGVVYNSPNIFKNLKDNAIADDFVLQYELRFVLN